MNRIIEEGHHVVGKASPGGDPGLEWRLSFSEAELTLAEHRTHIQKKIYYIFKTIFKENLGKSDVISTYYLKTIVMWAMEQNPPEYWRENNIGQAVLGLLDDLYQALLTRNLSHYFIPQLNLLRHISWDILDEEAGDLLHLRKNILNINRNEPILLSPKAKGTEYETVMRVSRKKFKAHHAKLIEFLSRNGIRCYIEYYESVFSQTDNLSLFQERVKATSKKVLNESRCYAEYYESVFSNSEISIQIHKDLEDTLKKEMESRINLMQSFDFPKLDLLEEYLFDQYGNHTDLIKQKIKEEKENIKRDPRKAGETYGDLFVTDEIIKDLLELFKSNRLCLLYLYVNMSNQNNVIKLKTIHSLRDSKMKSERVDELINQTTLLNELINLATLLNAENVLKGISLEEVQYQKAIILKKLQHLKFAADHSLRETRTLVIETINSFDKLEKRAFALLNISIKATQGIGHIMSSPSLVYDKRSIQAKAKEYFKLTVEYKISDKFDTMYKVHQFIRKVEDSTNRLILDIEKLTEDIDFVWSGLCFFEHGK